MKITTMKKKILFSIMLLCAGMFTSCSMDKEPYGALNEKTAIQSMQDIGRLRLGIYTALRGLTSGGWIYYQDLQMDEFHGLISNGNRNGQVSAGEILASNDDIEGFFASSYSEIGNANYIMQKVEDVSKIEGLTEADKVTLKKYDSEAHFLRAYCYFFLAEHFCQPYAENSKALGLPIVTKFNPTGDVASYPARSSMDETYKLIEEDLKIAYDGLKAYEQVNADQVKPMAVELSSYAVAALQARVALYKGDYPTALAKSKEIISSGKYKLTKPENVKSLWTEDNSTEIIFRPFRSKDELGSSTAVPYISGDNKSSADYIPTYEVLARYGEGDVRFAAYFEQWKLDIEGAKYDAFVLNKYPGNKNLWTTTKNNYVNMSKPFRLGEIFLIAAEAAAKTGNEAEANHYLNSIRYSRIKNYDLTSSVGETLLNYIYEERAKELFGEGFRFYDLKRLHRGFKRYASHEENSKLDGVVVNNTKSVTYAIDDYRYTWPIPKAELDANPQLRSQQNPGY